MHHQHGGILVPLIGVGDDEVGHPPRFLIHPARHVEIGKLEAGLRLLLRPRGGRGLGQRIQFGEKFLFPVLAPFVGVEQRPHCRGGAFGRDVGGRQRQSAGPSKHHLVGADFGFDVVGVRMHDHAVHGFQQRQFDEILPLDEATGRRRRGDDQQRIAGVGIDQPVHRTGIGQRHGDIGERGIGNVPQHHQRQRRRLAAVGEGQRPLGAVGAAFAFERRDLRPVEADADGLTLFQRQQADIADDGAALGADRFDIDRFGMVEHQPHRIGAAEQRSRGRRGKGERHAQAVAVTPRLDGGGPCPWRRFPAAELDAAGAALLRRLRGRWSLPGRYGLRRFRSGSLDLFGRLRRFRGFRRRRCFFRCGCHLLGRGGRVVLGRRHFFDGRRSRGLGHGRRFGHLGGLDLDPGLFGNRLRGNRRNLRRLLRRRRFLQGLVARNPRGRPGLGRYGRLGRGLRLGQSGLFRLLEGDIDHIVLFLAEGMHVDLADQHDVDCGRIDVGPLVDRGDVRRRRHLRIRQVEIEHAVELQRQLLIVQHRRHVDAVGHLEHEADEGRLHRGADPHRRLLLRGVDRHLRAKRALGGPRPLRQFAHDRRRKRGRRTGPAIGQEVDEDPLPRRHGVDGCPPRQRQPDRRTVGVAPRRADIIGNGVRQFVDGNIHRALEVDDDDRTRGRNLGFDILGQLQHQPGESASGRKRRLTPDRIVGAAGLRNSEAGEQAGQRQAAGRGTAGPPAPKRGPATQFQRQPFAPSRKSRGLNKFCGEARSPAVLNLGLADLRFC